ncbi:MAG: trypsin-like serine protease [Myxococcales bacterium]|nr:trypsin-like serine protease [Myxococcales bacterium]
MSMTISALATGCGAPPDAPVARRGAAITDGTEHYGHKAVGELEAGATGKIQLCTATLIGKRTVLTAAHCIEPGKPHVFKLEGQSYPAASVIRHEMWDPNINTFPNDVAVIILATAPPNIDPAIITKRPPAVGQELTLVGYGATSETAGDVGQKRIATNKIATITAARFSFTGTGGGIGNTCIGDSGGPAFSTFGGQEELVGVTSAGTVGACGQRGWDSRVDVYHSWIVQNAQGDVYQPGSSGDDQAPTVSITSPKDRATVSGKPTIEVDANDNVGVASVTLEIDGSERETKNAAPWTFSVDLAVGSHAIKVVARDDAGNAGSATITVTVGDGDKRAYGVACDEHAQCISGICASQANVKFCTEKCTAGGTPCPEGQCVDAGGGTSVCVPTNPGTPPGGGGVDQISGGCAVANGERANERGGAATPTPLLVVLCMLGLAAVLKRRRASRPRRR